jgi:hypothetical protein
VSFDVSRLNLVLMRLQAPGRIPSACGHAKAVILGQRSIGALRVDEARTLQRVISARAEKPPPVVMLAQELAVGSWHWQLAVGQETAGAFELRLRRRLAQYARYAS